VADSIEREPTRYYAALARREDSIQGDGPALARAQALVVANRQAASIGILATSALWWVLMLAPTEARHEAGLLSPKVLAQGSVTLLLATYSRTGLTHHFFGALLRQSTHFTAFLFG
jgi:hypothetical protein